jgi:hypothetical protein
LGFAEPPGAQAECGGGYRKGVVRSRDRVSPYSHRDREMKRVQRSERDVGQPDQQIAGAQGVPIFQGIHLQKSLSYIVFERRRRTSLGAGADIPIAAAAGQEATQLDCGEAADRYRLYILQETVEFIRTGFGQISLG